MSMEIQIKIYYKLNYVNILELSRCSHPSELMNLAKFEDNPLIILLLLSLSILFSNNGNFY